jgi:uncharacterized protein YdhG (YjbR/CyaY superfamily)
MAMSHEDIIMERLAVLTERVNELEDNLKAYVSWGVKSLAGGTAFLLWQVAHNLPAFAEYLK